MLMITRLCYISIHVEGWCFSRYVVFCQTQEVHGGRTHDFRSLEDRYRLVVCSFLAALQALHKMWPVATDVTSSVVCVSVCLLLTWLCCAKMAELIEMPFGELTRLVNRCGVPPWEGSILGLSGPSENRESLCCDVYSKRDHLILNNGMTAGLLQPTAMLLTGQCHITLSPMINLPTACDGAFRQNSTWPLVVCCLGSSAFWIFQHLLWILRFMRLKDFSLFPLAACKTCIVLVIGWRPCVAGWPAGAIAASMHFILVPLSQAAMTDLLTFTLRTKLLIVAVTVTLEIAVYVLISHM